VSSDLFAAVKESRRVLETLFVFGTNRNALESVISQLREEEAAEGEATLSLAVNEAAEGRLLLVPVYRETARLIGEDRHLRKLKLHDSELCLLQRYAEYVQDDRVLLATYEVPPARIKLFRQGLADPDSHFNTEGPKRFSDIGVLVRQVLAYMDVHPQELERFKGLDDEIRHFRQIRVALLDFEEVRRKATRVGKSEDRLKKLSKEYMPKIQEAEGWYQTKLIEEYAEKRSQVPRRDRYSRGGRDISFKHIATHYYLPVILAEDEKVDYIRHIIKVPSEVRFVKQVSQYLENGGTVFEQFDWWMFSKLDESLDSVYIPYYDPVANRIRQHHPDFIFWLQRGGEYSIVFVDPKGTTHTDYEFKVDGYRALFEIEGKAAVIEHEGLSVRVYSFLQTPDRAKVGESYRSYWFDNIQDLLDRVIAGADRRSSTGGKDMREPRAE